VVATQDDFGFIPSTHILL
jgi:hypothetical protein